MAFGDNSCLQNDTVDKKCVLLYREFQTFTKNDDLRRAAFTRAFDSRFGVLLAVHEALRLRLLLGDLGLQVREAGLAVVRKQLPQNTRRL